MPTSKNHALIQLVSVWVAGESLSFGQLIIESVCNKITVIPALLEVIDCAGAMTSIGAICCQKEALKIKPQAYSSLIREYWQIENKLHWQ